MVCLFDWIALRWKQLQQPNGPKYMYTYVFKIKRAECEVDEETSLNKKKQQQ